MIRISHQCYNQCLVWIQSQTAMSPIWVSMVLNVSHNFIFHLDLFHNCCAISSMHFAHCLPLISTCKAKKYSGPMLKLRCQFPCILPTCILTGTLFGIDFNAQGSETFMTNANVDGSTTICTQCEQALVITGGSIVYMYKIPMHRHTMCYLCVASSMKLLHSSISRWSPQPPLGLGVRPAERGRPATTSLLGNILLLLFWSKSSSCLTLTSGLQFLPLWCTPLK